LKRAAQDGRNPRDIKIELGKEIVTRFHSARDADRAEQEFMARFKDHVAPDEMPRVTLAADASGDLVIAAALKQAGLTPSTSEAVRNIEQGGVKIDGAKVADRMLRLGRGTYVVQVGKRKWARVTIT